ncbi:chromosome-associated kinesin KIF4 [Culicoides brevitarsis]|uniref:chromosome-associated kinesin KIF4 n=1 Tax=Culicoides brevitarsis TaxID=469753 RepID=UPI00307BD7AC
MASNVMVAVRIRPLVHSEIIKGCVEVVTKTDGEPQVNVRDKEAFTFNHVFSQKDSQEQVYSDAVEPMIENLFKGYNITILAYGQTGSGKTYTMGTASNGEEGQNMGVIPRAVREIFEKIQEKDDSDVKITCSFYELYNEEVFDLLTDENVSRENSVRKVQMNKIEGLSEKSVFKPEDCLNYLQSGSQKRTVGATAMNKESSRSHAVYSLNLCISPHDGSPEITSKFLLVDLAGSERCKKTNATGTRMKEGVNINMGLFSLGKVICALCDSKSSHIPYRESVLTRLLQDSLGGNSYTLMIACVSPADYNVEETNNTLVYANRAKQIKNKPTVNMDPTKQELKMLKAEVERLRLALVGKNPGLAYPNIGNENVDPVEMQRLNQKNNELTKQLHNTLIDLTNVEMRAILAEDVCVEVGQKVDEFKLFILKYFEEKLSDPETLAQITSMFEEIDKIMAQYKSEKNQTISSVNDTSMNDSHHGQDDIQENFEKHTVKQQDYATKLRDLNTALALKEQLHQKIKENCSRLTTYDPDVTSVDINKDYLEQIQHLTKELEDVKNQKTEQKCAKLAEERRKKVQELEGKIEVLRKKCQQQEKLLKLKAKDGERVKLLDREIKEMKTSKVKLIRQMRLESDQFRQWRLSKEREITKMKEVDQKRKLELIRKESMHQKQQNVLRRKMEEAIATSKRLKEALDKQSSARAQKNSKNTNIQQNLINELLVIHSIVDAKMSVKSLMDDRATLNARLLQIKKHPKENAAEIQSIQQQIELRSAQISDLQTQVISMDIDAKIKEIGDQISNMADYKMAYNSLMKQSITDRENYIQYKLEMDELRVHAEQLEEDSKAQKDLLRQQELKYEQRINDMQKHYEEKMSWVLREIDVLKKKESLNDTFVIESEKGFGEAMADTMEQLRNELESYKQKCADLEAQLENKAKPAPKQKKSVSRVYEDPHSDFEFIDETDDDEDDDLDNSTLDPEWRKTPLSKRTRRTTSLIRKSFAIPDVPRKMSTEGPNKCACKGNCSTKVCSCRKRNERCGDHCKCDHEKCLNIVKNEFNENDENEGEMTPMVKKEGNVSRKHSMDEDGANATFDTSVATPKKMRLPDLDVTTPVYIYSQKKRKPLLEPELLNNNAAKHLQLPQ